ncbi:SDR family NAD(P)-dependent oxidoreductase [Paenibacillus brasilensis]|nr:SDR family NAD(P)-dependent oxidoreductase [Paenibacillus brasilensis]
MNKTLNTLITIAHPIIKHHLVKGQPLLPGLAYIDMLYQLAKQSLGLDYQRHCLKKLSIFNPLIVREDQPVELKISFNKNASYWDVSVNGTETDLHGNPLQEKLYITAELHEEEVKLDNYINIEAMQRTAVRYLNIETLYEQARAQGLVHTGMIKADAEIYLTNPGCFVIVDVGADYRSEAEHYLFHPTLIDGTGLASEALIEKDGNSAAEELYIPLYYEAFYCKEPLRTRCYATVHLSSGHSGKEIRVMDILFFNAEGTQIGELRGLTTKRVRFDGQINPSMPKEINRNQGSVQERLSQIFSKYLAWEASEIDVNIGFYELGLESAQLLAVVKDLEEAFGLALAPTVLFEYTTIAELAAYFTEKGAAPIGQFNSGIQEMNQGQAEEDIAIIGMAGRFPQSRNIEEFWDNLKEGKDCIREIPKSRWNWEEFKELKSPSGKNISKWGGFIDEPDCFDHQFFRVTPREAKTLDPQERLFLETCWEAIEDSGYTASTLAMTPGEVKRHPVGVFVGVMHKDYSLIGAEAMARGSVFPLSLNYGQIANRVSYFCNFHGPSMAVDTLCSSSLTAVHLALESIQRGECEVALAGGVNLLLHPNKYIAYGMMDFHSSDGYCRTFGNEGDGYVSGEGIGAVILKPLSKAIQARDHIYAVIKGSAVNHGGTVSGITVPSPVAQADVVTECLKKTGIHPRTISYVEAHGTGTSLGDPIEIQGLMKAYRRYTEETQYCAIGSVKSNIGHSESAAGISGLIKVALQLYHKTLVPSLHAEEVNTHIHFEQSPFYIQRRNEEWKQPVLNKNGKEAAYPRRAGLSSFGATGSNAHVILEEYVPEAVPQQTTGAVNNHSDPVIILLSAKNKERLQAYAKKLLEFLKYSEVNLNSLAYTLQVGRENMEERAAFVVQDVSALMIKLQHFIDGRKEMDEYLQGQVKKSKGVTDADQSYPTLINQWAGIRDYMKIAEHWVTGHRIEWESLYGGIKPQRISLPTYPFARERFWVPELEDKLVRTPIDSNAVTAIHPLLHQNTSDLAEQRFTSNFTGKEFFLEDLQTAGSSTLLIGAYLEMARAAVDQATSSIREDNSRIKLKDVIWAKPVDVQQQPVQVHIGLFPEDNGEIAYEIYTAPGLPGSEPVLHCQGSSFLNSDTEAPALDIKAIQKQCQQGDLSSGQRDQAKARGIGTLWMGTGQALVKMALSTSAASAQYPFILHPSLIDSALQAAIVFMESTAKSYDGKAHAGYVLPYALQELEIFGNCSSAMWALIRCSGNDEAGGRERKFDIDICDEQGKVCVRIRRFSIRVAGLDIQPAAAPPASDALLMLKPGWKEQAALEGAGDSGYSRHLVVLCEISGISREDLEGNMPEAQCLVLQSAQGELDQRFQEYAAQIFDEVKSILKAKPKEKALLQLVAPARGQQQLFRALSGILYTAQFENPKVMGQLIEVEPGEDTGSLIAKLNENSRSLADKQVQYIDGKRRVAVWSEISAGASRVKPLWKDHGIYLITGGAGGLGLIFAGEIAGQAKHATLILTGRSPLNEDKQSALKALEAAGARVEYRRVDVVHKEEVAALIRDIRNDYGALHGIIHSAGIIRDNFILRKTKEDLQAVMAPKVSGLVNLDEASRDLPLDFFIFFSSMAGAVGNVGQADYATANAFMDAYAGYRNSLVLLKQRQGRTLSVNWPLWKEGGMHVDEETEKVMMKDFGIAPMRTETGVQALYHAFASGSDRVMVMEGNPVRLKEKFLPESPAWPETEAPSLTEDHDLGALPEQVRKDCIRRVARLLQTGTEDIDPDAEWNDYGLDVVALTGLVNELNQAYGLDWTYDIFLEYPTLRSLADDLLETCKGRLPRPVEGDASSAPAAPAVSASAIDTELLKEKTLHQLKVMFGDITKMRVDSIDGEESLESYGIDSIMINQLNQKLGDIFGELSKTLFYEYRTLLELAEYLVSDHSPGCLKWTGLTERVQALPPHAAQGNFDHELPVLASRKAGRRKARSFTAGAPAAAAREPVAIIGISGRYPKAGSLQEYWDNLRRGQDCITEIPEERWSKEGFFQPDPQEAAAQGKSYSKWGGFIDGFAEFDPLFFNISPLEAHNMDPQERLFVQSCWEVLEDAGYTREQIRSQYNGKVGVFAGITKTGYDLYGPDLWKQGERVFPHTSFSSVANRISYLLNLQGPSMPIDTMCSSSLTAIHEACEHLYQQECEMAVAGGVNLYLHPSSYVGLCAQQMLSADGQCKSFGSGGNGFVPGEGVGCVLLKPLSKAVADGDHIYAVIRSTSINHGGKTNGYTVPNPVAQAELIRTALDKAGIHARTVSYIEAHGTGTALGDPIEITGLTQAFGRDTQDSGYCAIGSVKSNIGHLEAAAGIAGVTKILLQMKHGKLAPSLHAKELNPNIQFAKTPFAVQQELADWKRPVVDGQEVPRRAGISSFGAGGSNAHVVLEEYIPAQQEAASAAVTPEKPAIIVLSAKNEEGLKAQVQRLLAAIEEQPWTEGDLADIAYTLQTGREAMEERLGVIVDSIGQLKAKLRGFAAGQDGLEHVYRGKVKQNKGTSAIFTADEDMQTAIDSWLVKGKYSKLLDLWVKGVMIDWNKLYGSAKRRKVSLPTYPFAKERYWVDKIGEHNGNNWPASAEASVIHPLLHRNTSDLSEQRFTSTFTGKEFFLGSHIVKGQRVLPGVAYLEMARAAVEHGALKGRRTGIRLKNIVWAKPIVVGVQPVQIHIGLFPEGNGEISYEIYSEAETVDAQQVVHSQGIALPCRLAETPALDIHAVQESCTQNIISPEALKTRTAGHDGIHHWLEEVYVGEAQVLAKICLPSCMSGAEGQFILHPDIVDSALQASAGSMMGTEGNKPCLPFSLQNMEILGKCTSNMWALIRFDNGSKDRERLEMLDIDLYDEHGAACVRMKGFTGKR